MNVIPLEKSKVTLPEAAELARSGTVILTRNGKPLAAVKDLTDEDWESVSLANNPRFRQLIEESRRSYCDEGGVRLEDLGKQLGLKPKKSSTHRKKR